MAYDVGKIPESLLGMLAEGINREEGSLADLLCTRREVDALTGTITVEPSASNIPRKPLDSAGSLDTDPGIAEGAEHGVRDDEYDEVSYHCRRYGDAAFVKLAIIAALDKKTGKSNLQKKIANARKGAMRKVDAKLRGVLTDTNLNESTAVTTLWSDSTSAPFKDIRTNLRGLLGADTIVMGGDVADALADHPDFLAEKSNFSAGTLGDGEVANVLRKKFSKVTNIIVADSYFSNTNPEGVSGLNTEFDFDGLFWMGYKKDLLLTEFSAMSPHTDQDKAVLRAGQIIVWERRLDIIRPHKEMGKLLTGVV